MIKDNSQHAKVSRVISLSVQSMVENGELIIDVRDSKVRYIFDDADGLHRGAIHANGSVIAVTRVNHDDKTILFGTRQNALFDSDAGSLAYDEYVKDYTVCFAALVGQVLLAIESKAYPSKSRESHE